MRCLLLTVAMSAALVLSGCAEFDYGASGGRASGPAPTAYTVMSGDTLQGIAWRYGLDYRRVARWNSLHPPYTIYVGDTLRLRPPPGGESGTRSASRAPQRMPRSAPEPEPKPIEGWSWPVQGRILKKFQPEGTGKQGITIGGTIDTPVRAAAAGRVVYSGNGLRGYGNLVIVKHNSRYLTAYGYNRSLLVDEGDRVQSGDTIARMGSGPGRRAALHFEIRRDGRPVDPLRYLPAR